MTTPAHPLTGYVARLLLGRVASTPRIQVAEALEATGVLLLSDIERFTTLVETFSVAGPAGLEELTWILNGYFADLADTVHVHGGDILYVAGDAFLCHWAATRESLGETVVRATQCGLDIQERLHDRQARPGTTILTRIGIGAGPLVTAFVGGTGGRWELVVSGQTLGDTIDAESRARAGQVLLHPAAMAAAANRVQASTDGDGFANVERITQPVPIRGLPPLAVIVDDDIIRPLCPPAVVDRLHVPDAQWLAESRRVSVLLADLPLLDSADPAAVARTQAAVRTFQEVVERYDGTIKVDVDAKGILLLAIFGLPPRAHEDDAERAALAGQQLAAALDSSGTPVGVGIATGRAICGAFGSAARRDYMVRGDAINLAARLMQVAAPGEVLCDEATVTATRGRMEFRTGATVSVKGRTTPVPTFHPVQRRDASKRDHGTMVGREAEQATIAAALSGLSSDRSATILIEADAGLGKSRLLAGSITAARAAGLDVLQAGADAIEQTTPFYAWRPVFLSLFDLAPGIEPAVAHSRVTERITALPGFERMAPLIGAVLPFPFADNDLTADMAGDVRAANTRRLLVALLRDAASTGRLVIALEDAHWLDSASWDLLLDATTITPLVTLVTTRPMSDPVPAGFERLAAAAGTQRLRLTGLTTPEMSALMGQRLGVAVVPDELAAFIQERVSGHPFFAEELLQAMVDRGAVRVSGGECEVGDLSALDLPTTVEQVIVSRLDRLTPAEQLCLKVASVIGRIFRSRLVQQAYPVTGEREHVPAHLVSLTGADLIGTERPEPDLAYLFRHVITRDVTYETMPLAQRRPLHRAVAEWHESQFQDLTPYYGLLAYHWSHAADPVRTAHYLDLAGRQAVRSGGFREATTLFTQALELMNGRAIPEDRLQRALWERDLGHARYYLSDIQGAKKHLANALAGLHKPVPSTEAAAIRGALAAAASQVMHRLRPAHYRGRRVAEREVLNHAVECYRILADAYYMVGDPPVWLVYGNMSALNVGEEAGDSPSLARVLMGTAMLVYIVGLTGAAAHYESRSLAMLETQDDLTARAHTWALRALLLAQQARWKESVESSQRALAMSRELGDAGMESHIVLVLSTVRHCSGDFVNAPAAWAALRDVAARTGNTMLHCWSLLDEVESLLAQGQLDQADRVLTDALAIETPAGDALMNMEKQHGIALVRQSQGRFAEALAAADVTFDYLSKTPPNGYYMADHFAVAVEVYLEALRRGASLPADRTVDVRRRATRGVKLLTKYSRTFVPVRARASLLRGQLALLDGKVDMARAAFERSVTLATAVDMSFERARALTELAGLDPSRAPSLRSEARTLFDSSGATGWPV